MTPSTIATGGDSGSAGRLKGYPGNKGADGTRHRIIGMMPPHDVYIEAFAGSAALFRAKRPAAFSVLIDRDPDVCRQLRAEFSAATVLCGDARSLLPGVIVEAEKNRHRALIYADPPYVMSSRRSERQIYRYELTDEDHLELLMLLRRLAPSSAVMLSGYRTALYDDSLFDWQRIDFKAATHRGVAIESVWFNFALQALHDWRYIGSNFRERERIKRKMWRWRSKLLAMPELERQALLAALLDLASPEIESGSQALPAGRPAVGGAS